jgi:enoyl-CoA hydratase/carnithine racemase
MSPITNPSSPVPGESDQSLPIPSSLKNGLQIRHSELAEGVIVLTLHRPETRNAIDLPLAKELHKVLQELKTASEEIRLLVLESCNENYFCSGGDLREVLKFSPTESSLFTQTMQDCCKTLHELPFPTVALWGGEAIGGGAELVLATDFRLPLSIHTKLLLSQAKWGVPGGWGGMERLQELAPSLNVRKCSWLFAKQTCLDYAKLLELGILDEEAPAEPWQIYERLIQWSQNLMDLENTLWQGFLLRARITIKDNLGAYDKAFFDQHWLNAHHTQKISQWFRAKTKD